MPANRPRTLADLQRWRRMRAKRRWYKRSFRLQVMLLVGLLLAGMLLAQGAYLNYRLAETVTHQMGERALAVARTVAAMPEVINAFATPEPARIIQPLAEQVRQQTGARYVVVGNTQTVRYSHPIAERIGQRMVGGDNEQALVHGQSYVSEATGTLGTAMRGKTPIRDAQGNIIGVVSVGFMLERVDMDAARYTSLGWMLVALMILLGFAGAFWLSQHLKKVILGLEPYEIARLAMEKEAILQSIHEGVLAVNRDGNITLVNQQARRFLGLPDEHVLLGQPIREVVPNSRLVEVLKRGEQQFDQEMWLGDHPVVANRVPILHEGEIEGAVATFRSRREIVDLSQALTQASRDVDMLRAQAHEFSNKLYTISGLLQLERIDEALALIHHETERAQAQMSFLMRHVADAVLSGTLLGKLTRARELGVALEIDEHSSLSCSLTVTGQEVMMSIVGNLLDNACHAALNGPNRDTPKVRLFFTDLGEQLLIEVEDNGPGVPDELTKAIFQEGFSTKTGKHSGIGLALVARLCRQHGGEVTLEEGELGGACFLAVLDRSLCASSATTLAS
ncbi:ATP-binding protein [Halomonas sp. LS-001]